MKTVTIYTDGSCESKSRLGGIGVYGVLENSRGNESYSIDFEISKGYSDTTISRMELRAIIEALQKITDKYCKIQIYSDSQYTINSINIGWVFNWELDGFLGRKNADLWKLFLKEYRKFPKENIIFNHCKGHAGVEGNEIADALCDYKQFKTYIKDEIVK